MNLTNDGGYREVASGPFLPYDQRVLAALVGDFGDALRGAVSLAVYDDLTRAFGLKLIADDDFFAPVYHGTEFLAEDSHTEVDQLLALIGERRDGQQVLASLDVALDDAGAEAAPRPRIAIAGRKYAGKSTLAQRLSHEFQLPMDGFAYRMKQAFRVMGFAVDGPDKDVAILQQFGTDIVRQRNPDHWVELLDSRVAGLLDEGLVIDDLRFPNELAWCRAHGFIIVYLVVDLYMQRQRAEAMGVDARVLQSLGHASETGLNAHSRDSHGNPLFDIIVGTSLSSPDEVYDAVLREANILGLL